MIRVEHSSTLIVLEASQCRCIVNTKKLVNRVQTACPSSITDVPKTIAGQTAVYAKMNKE